MSGDTVLELWGVVSQELYSGRFRVVADNGEEVLAYVHPSTRIATAVRQGDRVHLALRLEDTAPARILQVVSPATSPGR